MPAKTWWAYFPSIEKMDHGLILTEQLKSFANSSVEIEVVPKPERDSHQMECVALRRFIKLSGEYDRKGMEQAIEEANTIRDRRL